MARPTGSSAIPRSAVPGWRPGKSARTANTSANQALDQIRSGVPRAQSADSARTAGSATSASRAGDADKLDGKDSSEFAGSSHNHDDRYYTEAEVDAAIAAAKDDAWAYVISNGGLHASSGGNITVTKPAPGSTASSSPSVPPTRPLRRRSPTPAATRS